MQDFYTNQNFAFTIVSSVEGLSTAIQSFLSFEFKEAFTRSISLVMLFVSHLWTFFNINTLLSL